MKMDSRWVIGTTIDDEESFSRIPIEADKGNTSTSMARRCRLFWDF
jgi:hypothetical protein